MKRAMRVDIRVHMSTIDDSKQCKGMFFDMNINYLNSDDLCFDIFLYLFCSFLLLYYSKRFFEAPVTLFLLP